MRRRTAILGNGGAFALGLLAWLVQQDSTPQNADESSAVMGESSAVMGESSAVMDESSAVQFVEAGRLELRAVPLEQGAPLIGELFQGTAVLIQEQKKGFSRISLQAWVPTDALTASRPGAPASGESVNLETAWVTDTSRAHHLAVAVERVGADEDDGHLRVDLTLRTRTGERIDPGDDFSVAGEVLVFEERRIAGGRLRGDRLLQKAITFDDRTTVVELPLSELDHRPARILVSARVELAENRTLLGSATSIPLGDEAPE